AGLSALRILEDEAARGRGEKIFLRAGREAAVYVLNKKRAELADIEQRYGVNIEIVIDESFEGARMTVDSSGPRPVAAPRATVAGPAAESWREGGRRRRRRGGRGGASTDVEETSGEPRIEPDSSPMVERPIDEEPAIAETERAEAPQPDKPKRGRRKKAAPE